VRLVRSDVLTAGVQCCGTTVATMRLIIIVMTTVLYTGRATRYYRNAMKVKQNFLQHLVFHLILIEQKIVKVLVIK